MLARARRRDDLLSHKLDESFTSAIGITVLRDGKTIIPHRRLKPMSRALSAKMVVAPSIKSFLTLNTIAAQLFLKCRDVTVEIRGSCKLHGRRRRIHAPQSEVLASPA